MSKIVLVTGGFDPLHSGHINYFKAARILGDKLWVGLNSDAWLARKKGQHFMPWEERGMIVRNLWMVDRVIEFKDTDDTACDAIHEALSQGAEHIIFANGGDRQQDTTPEQNFFINAPNIQFVFGVGGTDKINSSSWILGEWKAPKTVRDWGHYRNLYKGKGFQVKELVIAPHSKLSMQRHKHRSETWNLVSGSAYVKTHTGSDPHNSCSILNLSIHNPVDIPARTWHQGCNDTNEPAHIIEIWKGKSELLTEDDIERYE
tara:strand:- start:507 stop:1286 length:780 start_codon:yes stop_codon:yes gene_type:complete